MIRRKGRTALLALSLAAALALITAATASAEWTPTTIDVSVARLSTGANYSASLDALILDDETLYVPFELIFGAGGLASEAGATWAIRDGKVYIRDGAGARVIPIEVVDGRAYVPALDTLGALGMNGAVGNMNRLTVTMW